MDAYTVGATLGAGAPALIDGDKLLLPDVYERVEILDNGPLRFTVCEEMYETNGVKETRLISQDKGTHLAKIQSSFSHSNSSLLPCAGIAVHESQPSAYTLNKKWNFVTYADALDTPKGQNGQLYIGVLFPEKMKALKYLPLKEKKSGAIGHVIGVGKGTSITYFAGSAWSQYDVPNQQVWETLMQGYAQNIQQPLEVVLK
jgi:hypothetical protein